VKPKSRIARATTATLSAIVTSGTVRQWRGAPAVALAVLSLLACVTANAGDIAAGRRKALQCQVCHGLDGISKLPEAPHLAGQPERYLVKSLEEYRSGARKNDLMTLVVQNLGDQDIADLAAYYAAIEISATPPK
jgi:cytochrome c553